MGQLQSFFENGNHRIIDKWIHYFEIYERYLSVYKGKTINILEIGVSHGGSLQMWKDYFGEGTNIFGIDINPECKKFEEDGIKIFIGSQSDRNFLKETASHLPDLDVIIDDGGHMMDQQIISFEELFSHLKPGGLYICEDLHTSYWLTHGGGYKRRGTFIEYSKNLIDYLHGWHSQQKHFRINNFTKNIYGLHFYDSVLVIEKREIAKPYSKRIGDPSFREDFDWSEKRSLLQIILGYFDATMARLRISKRF